MRSVDATLGQIIADLGGELKGLSALVTSRTPIHGISSLANADSSSISFLSTSKYVSQLQSTEAACVIVSPQHEALAIARGACIVSDDPYHYYALLSQWWKRRAALAQVAAGDAKPLIHTTAVIGQGVILGQGVRIGALSVIEDGVHIGSGTVIHSRVTVGEACHIGQDCTLHSGVVIGADGFGFAQRKDTGAWTKIEQLGAVRIGNQVEIGANTCIDRGALEDTVLEDGVKLDNLIQIGHNVHVGAHTAMAGCVGVAGSAKIGAHCTLGGGAIVLGHLTVADHVHISAATVVTRSISKPGQYTGLYPIDDNQSWEKNAASLKQLSSLRDRIKQIEKMQTIT